MRVYLLNPPFKEGFVRSGRWQGCVARGKSMYYPIWLAYAAGELEREHTVRLVDAPASKLTTPQVKDDVIRFKPDVVLVDTSFASISNDLSVASQIRRVSSASVGMVGPPMSVHAHMVMENSDIDFVLRNEYEASAVDLTRRIEKGIPFNDVPGVVTRIDGSVHEGPPPIETTSDDLERFGFVSEVYSSHLCLRNYSLDHVQFPMIQVITSRGCPNMCTFCSWPCNFTGRRFRTRSPKNIADEFQYVADSLKEVKEIFIEDDTFTTDRSHVRAVCEEIVSRRVEISWSCNARANLDYHTMRMMKEAGCRLLDVGFESGSESLLRSMKKGIAKESMLRFADDARKANLMVLGDFIIGMPGETRTTMEETFDFAKKLRPNLVQFAVATPIPGTEFYREVEGSGSLRTKDMTKSIDRKGYQRAIVEYPNLKASEIQRFVKLAYRRYYLSLAFLTTVFRNLLRSTALEELRSLIRASTRAFKFMLQGRETDD